MVVGEVVVGVEERALLSDGSDLELELLRKGQFMVVRRPFLLLLLLFPLELLPLTPLTELVGVRRRVMSIGGSLPR